MFIQPLKEREVKPCTRTEQGDDDGQRWEDVESDLGMDTKLSTTPVFSKCDAHYQFAASIEHIGYRSDGDDADALRVGERNCCMHLNSGSALILLY